QRPHRGPLSNPSVSVPPDDLIARIRGSVVVHDAVGATLRLERGHRSPRIAAVEEEDVPVAHEGVALLHVAARDVVPVRVRVIEAGRVVRVAAVRERFGAGHLPNLADVTGAVRAPRSGVRAVGAAAVARALAARARRPAAATPVIREAEAAARAIDRV